MVTESENYCRCLIKHEIMFRTNINQWWNDIDFSITTQSIIYLYIWNRFPWRHVFLHRKDKHRAFSPTPHRAVKWPWIFPGTPLIFNGAPGNIQGNLTSDPMSNMKVIIVRSYTVVSILISMCEYNGLHIADDSSGCFFGISFVYFDKKRELIVKFENRYCNFLSSKCISKLLAEKCWSVFVYIAPSNPPTTKQAVMFA